MAMILAGKFANTLELAAQTPESISRLSLFDPANDGHPFALDREGLTAYYAAIPATRFKILYDPISSSFQQPVARP